VHPAVRSSRPAATAKSYVVDKAATLTRAESLFSKAVVLLKGAA